MYKVIISYDKGHHSSAGKPAGEDGEFTQSFENEKEAREFFYMLRHIVDLGVEVELINPKRVMIDYCCLTDMP